MITSVYIHVPFCEHICTYCDFAKRFYNEKIIFSYLDALEKEIKEKYQGEIIQTIYIGGGTPSSLSFKALKRLMEIVKIFPLSNNYEFTIEVNPENIGEDKILLFKNSGVNRISMGVESTSKKNLQYLGRKHNYEIVKEKIRLLKKYGFKNINVDLIYALPNETIVDVKKDLDNLLSLDVQHLSTYSLEIHDNTILGIKNTPYISDEKDREMYDFICQYLKEKGFNHYEISNFCKSNYESRHNLVYWHNEEYYGFGMGASGYIGNIRYNNTRSYYNYLHNKRIIYQEELSMQDEITYELILGFRLVNGINKNDFMKKYHKKLVNIFNIDELIKKGYLIDDGEYIKISEDKLYIENSILENFVH